VKLKCSGVRNSSSEKELSSFDCCEGAFEKCYETLSKKSNNQEKTQNPKEEFRFCTA